METYNFDTFEWAKVIVGKNKDLDKLLKTATKPFIIKVKRQKNVIVSAEKPPTGTYTYYGPNCYLQGINAEKIMPSTEELSEPEPEEADCHGHRLFE
jgi:hypothetical protein